MHSPDSGHSPHMGSAKQSSTRCGRLASGRTSCREWAKGEGTGMRDAEGAGMDDEG